MLLDVSLVIYGIFKKYMDPKSFIHSDKDGIHVYDINTPAEELYKKFTTKEKEILKKYNWIIDDGEFVKPN